MKSLITKFKGIVDNNSLLKIGELRFSIKKSDDVRNYFVFMGSAGKPVTSTVSGNNYFTDKDGTTNRGTSISFENTINKDTYFKSIEDGYYSVLSKYDIISAKITSYNEVEFDVAVFKYCKNILGLNVLSSSAIGDIASLKLLDNLRTLYLTNSTYITGDIASLKSLINLSIISINGTNISGDIASLKSLINLTSINVSGTKISGDCKNLFDGLVAAGKQNGTLKIITINKEVCYNGVAPTKRVWTATFNNGSYSVENTDV